MEKPLIKDFLKKEALEGDIGLEVELESGAETNLPEISTVWWQSVGDNSLRNGREYVTKKPLPLDERTFERIQFLFKQVATPRRKVQVSHRTSVHVHNNVSQYTPTQVWTIVVGYWLFENLLFEYCGEERKGNHFCLRLKDAEDLVDICFEEISSQRIFQNIASDNIKYGGINLNAIHKFGSLEYRGMRGTTDPKVIYNWAATLNMMQKNIAKYWSSPEDLLDFYYKNGWNSTASLAFTGAPLRDFLLAVNKADDLVEENVYRVIKIAYGVSWSGYDKGIAKLFKKKPTKAETIAETVSRNMDMWDGSLFPPRRTVVRS